jgi:hypothetical protein
MLSVQETGFVVLYLYIDLFPLKLGVLQEEKFFNHRFYDTIF